MWIIKYFESGVDLESKLKWFSMNLLTFMMLIKEREVPFNYFPWNFGSTKTCLVTSGAYKTKPPSQKQGLGIFIATGFHIFFWSSFALMDLQHQCHPFLSLSHTPISNGIIWIENIVKGYKQA